MLELMTRRWQVVVLRGVLAVLFGLIAIVWPQITVLALAILWGVFTLVDGIAATAMGVGKGVGSKGDRAYLIVLGVLGIIAGVITFLWPAITVVVLLVVIAVWAIIAGIMQIVAAFRLRKVVRNEWFLAVSGLVTLALGILLIVQPAEGAVALVIAIATFAIAWGIVLIVFGFRLRSLRGRDPAVSQPGPAGGARHG